jgi:hypothetical protein
MSEPPKILAENEIVVFFETNRPLPAGDVGTFLAELDRLAHIRPELGAGGILELVEVQTGTLWTKLAWIVGIGGNLAGLGSFALDVSERLQSTDNALAECTARMVIEHGIRATTVITCEGSTEILREMMPQVEKLERLRSEEGKIDEADASGTTSLGAASGHASPASDYTPPVGDDVNFNFGSDATGTSDAVHQLTAGDAPIIFGHGDPQGKWSGAARPLTPDADGAKRDADLSERILTRKGEGWIASPSPPLTGDALPITVAADRTINIKHATAVVRGHVVRINGNPMAFEITDVVTGGTVTRTIGRSQDPRPGR